jgi:hypothetical protein
VLKMLELISDISFWFYSLIFSNAEMWAFKSWLWVWATGEGKGQVGPHRKGIISEQYQDN